MVPSRFSARREKGDADAGGYIHTRFQYWLCSENVDSFGCFEHRSNGTAKDDLDSEKNGHRRECSQLLNNVRHPGELGRIFRPETADEMKKFAVPLRLSSRQTVSIEFQFPKFDTLDILLVLSNNFIIVTIEFEFCGSLSAFVFSNPISNLSRELQVVDQQFLLQIGASSFTRMFHYYV